MGEKLANPETVSTDLRHLGPATFRALTVEDVLNVCEEGGAGRGDRPVRRQDAAETGRALGRRGVQSSARSPRASTWPRDRERFRLVSTVGLKQTPNATASSTREGRRRYRRADRLPGRRPAERSCWGAARWRSSTTRRAGPLGCGYMTEAVEPARKHPSWSTSPRTQRGRRDAVWTGTGDRRRREDHIEEAGIHRATRPARSAVQPLRSRSSPASSGRPMPGQALNGAGLMKSRSPSRRRDLSAGGQNARPRAPSVVSKATG